MNYKDTPAGRAVRQKYADILPLTRPEPSDHHPRMSLLNRAKIFSPFAALRGYEEEIAAEGAGHLKVAKTELSDEARKKLSDTLLQIQKGMTLTVCYFETDAAAAPAAPAGHYRTITGTVIRIDPVCQELQMEAEKKGSGKTAGSGAEFGKELPVVIPFDDILELRRAVISSSAPTDR